MTPSESQLRAALRDGEGQALDVDSVVAGAARLHRARRQRLASVAGAVIVVGGIGVGVVAVGRDGSGGPDTALAQRTAGATPATPAAGTGSRAGTAPRTRARAASMPADAAGTAIACPAHAPRLAAPGGGGTGGFGGSDALYAAPISAAKVCAYLDGADGVATTQVLTGAQAAELATSLEQAPSSRRRRECPNSTSEAGGPTLVIYALDAAGHRLRVVTASLGCPGLVTNGTATRYFWSPPTSLADLVGRRFVPIPTAVPTN